MADALFDSLLNKTATILRPVINGTPNALGERENTTNSTELDTVAVSLQPNQEKYEIETGGIKYWVELIVYMAITDVQINDRLEIDGIKYLVVGVENEAGLDHHLKIYVVKQ